MRRFLLSSLGLGMVVVLAGACTSGPESTIGAPSGQDDSDGVTGGEIIVSGDLTAGTAAPDPAADAAQDGSAAAAPTTTSATRATTAASTAPPTSKAPTRTPTSTTTRKTTAAPTTEAEVIGDGPVLTSPVGDDNSGESPGIGNGIRPVFFALEATTVVKCGASDPGTVSLRWEVIGTESVDVSIGFVGDIRSPGEPPSGTIRLPLDCSTGTQYFVIAENPDGETIRSVTVSPG